MLESSSLSSQAMWKIIEFNSNSTIITGIRHRISIIRKRTMSVFHENIESINFNQSNHFISHKSIPKIKFCYKSLEHNYCNKG